VSARQLVAELRERDVQVTASGGHLHVDAPAGVLTIADRDALLAQKPELLALLDHPCMSCGRALPPGNLYRCRECVDAAWWCVYGAAPMVEQNSYGA
jgi:hypothetical protein